VAQSKNDRRAAVDKIRREQKRADQRQGAIIVGVCVVIALLIVGLTAFRPIKDWWDLRKFNDLQLAEIGAPASACGEITTKKADQNQHVGNAQVEYADAPPTFGNHWDAPDRFDKWFYTAEERPEVEQLVHNLEHGYTIVWYDETIAEDPDALVELEAVAEKFNKLAGGSGPTANMRAKFKVVPWTSEDGKAFPDGQHVALTHWSRGGAPEGDRSKEQGIAQYCSEFSGEALEDFMEKYPYTDSPEPNAG
jgi:hypothetical protein